MRLENPQKLSILKASAGSGKTYNLAVNYLALALKEQSSYMHILAITFTNKATKEMKERILAFLLIIARNEDNYLIEQIATNANLSIAETVARAQLELRNILHNYSHFSVKTIDSFNQKILRGFAREIGLPGNFKLELDTKKVLDHAITRVIEDSGENPDVKKWIIDFSREKMEDGQSWDITKDLKSLAKELYNEQFKLLETIDPAIISSTPKLGEFIMTLKKVKRSFEDRMKIIGQEATALFQNYHLDPTDFYQGNRGVFQYFLSIQKPIDKYAPNSYVQKCQEEVEQWPSSKTPRKDVIIELSGEKLLPLLHQAILLYNNEHREYATASAILKNTYALGLFSEVKRAIDQYKLENDTFLLSDTNVFLRGIIRDNDTPFIYEKTGSWYHHFLIDEFQDTSRLQWENLKPLLVNSLDENNRNLIVGDAKQSIYRWRGGDWELLEKEISRSIGQERVEVKDLDTNWRSVTEVLQFNNALFDILPGIFRKTFLMETPQEFSFYADDFQKLFHNSTQKEGKNNWDFKGYVEINLIEKESESNESMLRLGNQIESLQDAGYALSEIAILTRTKSEGSKIIEFLNEKNRMNTGYRFNTVSNESLLIKNYPAIRLLVNGLQFLKDPGNDLNFANMAIEYFNENEDPGKLANLLAKTNIKDEFNMLFPKDFLSEIKRFQRYGLLECIPALIKVFHLERKIENAPYLMAFHDIVQKFISDNGNDVYSFLDWWEENQDKQALQNPENIDAIRVMTIHKSKGLEFEAVIIPFCDWGIDNGGKNNVFLWCYNESEKFPTQKIVPLKYVKNLANSHFANEYFDEKHRAYIDNLNLCYVAFTRAKRVLMINSQKVEKSFGGKKISSLLQQALEQEGFLQEMIKSENQFKYGELENIKTKKTVIDQASDMYRINDWRQKTRLKKRGKELFEKSEEGRKEKINYGIILHNILAQIKDRTEITSLLVQYRFQGILSHDEIDHIMEQLDAIFSNHEVAAWFDVGWDIKNEQSILSPNNEELRPDRVMIEGNKAIIVDFKTGKEMPEHTRQMTRYRNKLLEMGYAPVKAFVLYIQQNKVKEIA